MTAATNLLGGTPQIYEQAAELVSQIKARFPKKKITLTGQCFGGSVAGYAALRNNLPARCFNSLPLGGTLLTSGTRLIEYISTKTDYSSDNRKLKHGDIILTYLLGVRTPGNFGKLFIIQSAYETHQTLTSSLPFFRSANETHDYILGSMLKIMLPNWTDQDGHDATRARPIDYLRLTALQKKVVLELFNKQ